MALDPDSGQLQAGVPALLQAVGQLLIAMSPDDFPQYEPPPPPPQWMWTPWPAPHTRRRAPPPPPPPLRAEPARADHADGEVELILADARARAHRLIEDSVVRAQELLEERHGGDWQALERVRGSVGDLRDEIHALYERLDSIESLLRERPLPPLERTAIPRRRPW